MPVSQFPNASEQLMLELLNRARSDPAGETAAILAQTTPEIAHAIRYFKVDVGTLAADLEDAGPVAPLAWNTSLAAAAELHSQKMIDLQTQSHRLPGEAALSDRIEAAGYTGWSTVRENVYAYTKDALHGHAGFFIDWGYDNEDIDSDGELFADWADRGDEIQDPAGHRISILHEDVTEVGIGMLQAPEGSAVGPLVVTQNFGNRHDYAAQLVGVVIADIDSDGAYDIGEGLSGVTVTASGADGVYSTTSWASGGYQMALPDGRYDIAFSGGLLPGTLHYTATMDGANLKLDAMAGDAKGVLVTGQGGNEILIGNGSADILRGLGGNDLLLGDGLNPVTVPDASGQVYRLYLATLDRTPDAAGHADWTQRLVSGGIDADGAAAGFTGSREFQNTYGALDDAGFVTLLYRNVLDRAADRAGLTDWTDRLANGMDRSEVVLGFSDSREFRVATNAEADAFARTHSQAIWSDDVYRLYRATLDRAPDAAGFDDWLGKLGGGLAYDAAVAGFTGSREFQNTYGVLDDTGFVTLLYNNVLDRAPDKVGLADWTDQLDDGISRAKVVEGFAQSQEFVRATTPDLQAFLRGLGPDDVIDGGTGNDVLSGGARQDIFVFRPGEGSDRVIDFEPWDVLRLEGFDYADAAEALSHIRASGADTVFADQSTQVVLEHVTPDQIEGWQVELI